MNKWFEQYKNKIQQQLSQQHLEQHGDKHTVRDWTVLLSVFGLLIVVFCSVGVYAYYVGYGNYSTDVDEARYEAPTISRGALNSVELVYKEQNELFKLYRVEPPTAPSLGRVYEAPTPVEVETEDEEQEVVVE